MIVLDEQLMGRGLDADISSWYPGSVRFITELRPHTVIKDDAIPALLSQQADPTFVTINTSDFWLRVAASHRFCLVCVDIPDSSALRVPKMLRELFRQSRFSSKADRMGSVVRVSPSGILYYTSDDNTVRSI